jgi:hypothetical protein
MVRTNNTDEATKQRLIAKDALSSSEDMLEQFRRYSRAPFMDVLTLFMEAKPDPISLQMFARENPDKWATALGAIARLAGYHDKLEIEQNVNVQISHMGDAELLALLEKSEEEILALAKQSDGTYASDEAEPSTKKDPPEGG